MKRTSIGLMAALAAGMGSLGGLGSDPLGELRSSPALDISMYGKRQPRYRDRTATKRGAWHDHAPAGTKLARMASERRVGMGQPR